MFVFKKSGLFLFMELLMEKFGRVEKEDYSFSFKVEENLGS